MDRTEFVGTQSHGDSPVVPGLKLGVVQHGVGRGESRKDLTVHFSTIPFTQIRVDSEEATV